MPAGSRQGCMQSPMKRTSKGACEDCMKTGRLESEVEALTNRTIPMHMPGHKRLLCPSGKLPYDLDITEISGADDLHNADGILRRAMERASSLWGSGRTWFLPSRCTSSSRSCWRQMSATRSRQTARMHAPPAASTRRDSPSASPIP